MFEVVMCTLIVWQAVEVYRHSSLFATVRSYMDLVTGFFGSLHRCMFCLSVWVSFAVVVVWRTLNGFHHENPLSEIVSVFGYGLAISRLSNVLNDLLYDFTRTPKGGIPDDGL